jgi:hypothetical protein
MKKTENLINGAIIASLILVSCNNNKTTDTTSGIPAKEATSAAVDIIGKTATLAFPNGFKVDETFVSDTTLHWKLTNEKGEVIEEDEKVSFKKINDNQYFINWIEKSGLTVSQIVDPKNETVVSFISTADEKSERGKRSANFLEGTFKIKN